MFLHVLINNKTKQITISPEVTDILQYLFQIRVKWVSYGYWLETSSEKIRLKRMIQAKSGIARWACGVFTLFYFEKNAVSLLFIIDQSEV